MLALLLSSPTTDTHHNITMIFLLNCPFFELDLEHQFIYLFFLIIFKGET